MECEVYAGERPVMKSLHSKELELDFEISTQTIQDLYFE